MFLTRASTYWAWYRDSERIDALTQRGKRVSRVLRWRERRRFKAYMAVHNVMESGDLERRVALLTRLARRRSPEELEHLALGPLYSAHLQLGDTLKDAVAKSSSPQLHELWRTYVNVHLRKSEGSSDE
jgi:hypothetical protein